MWENMGTDTLSGGTWEGNHGRLKIPFFSDYDGRDDLATNETDSWERDHSYNTGNVNADGKC